MKKPLPSQVCVLSKFEVDSVFFNFIFLISSSSSHKPHCFKSPFHVPKQITLTHRLISACTCIFVGLINLFLFLSVSNMCVCVVCVRFVCLFSHCQLPSFKNPIRCTPNLGFTHTKNYENSPQCNFVSASSVDAGQ